MISGIEGKLTGFKVEIESIKVQGKGFRPLPAGH